MEPPGHDFRPGASRWLAALGALALMPFGIADLLEGDIRLGIGMLTLSAALWMGVLLLRRTGYRTWQVVVVFALPTTAFNSFAAARYDIFTTYWAFAIAMAFFLVLPRRWAIAMSALLAAAVAPPVWIVHGAQIGSRFAVCLVLIAAFGAVTVRLVDESQRRLVHQMNTDPLTGVLNRKTLTSRLGEAAPVGAIGPASILIIDVDHFKAINDGWGHEAGDLVLVGLTDLLRRDLGHDVPIFRLGGEEFLVLVECCGRRDAEAIAARLIDAVAAHRFFDRHTVTVSIGVAESSAGDTVNNWLRRADDALYAAKAAGRNTLVVG